MGQSNYTSDRTALTAGDYITLVQAEDTQYLKPTIDFYAAHKAALPKYAAGYAGGFYRKTSTLTAFSAAVKRDSNVSIYDEPVPSDCADKGIKSLEILKDSGDWVAEASIINQDSESSWDLTSANTTTIYWRQAGNRLRLAAPNAFTGSVHFQWASDYTRLPTYPSATGDYLDVPAEDDGSYYSLWKSLIRVP